MQSNVKSKILEIIYDTCGIALDVEETLKCCGIDSLALVSIIVAIEENYAIEFNDDDLDPSKIITFKDLIELTEKYI